MRGVGSDGEDEFRLSRSFTSSTTSSTKKLKFPRKFLDDCSAVCRVSVPRKLRSAIKKRSYEFVSPSLPVSKKLNHVVDRAELLKKEGSFTYKLKEGGAGDHVTDGTQRPVTKDEEEVAEALYALSGVFSSTVKANKHRFSEGSGANSCTLTKAESSVTTFDEGKVEGGPKTVSSRDEAPNHSSNAVGSAGDTFLLHCQNDITGPQISISKQLPLGFGCVIPEVNLPFTAFISENQHIIQKAICDSVISGASTDLSNTRSKLPNLEQSQSSIKYSETAMSLTAGACSQTEVQHIIKETRNYGSSIRPDLFSAISCDSQGSRIANLPASCSVQSLELQSSAIAKKDAQVFISSKNSWKGCCAHVYISRFIKGFQTTERKNMSLMQSSELTTNEAPKQGAHVTGERNDLIGVASTDSFVGPDPDKSVTDVRNAFLLHKRLVQDHQQEASAPFVVYTQKNQSFDFFSSPAGNCHLGTCNGISTSGNNVEVSTPLHFSYLLSQNLPSIPFQVPQNCYSSTSYSSQISLATVQKLRIPPYIGSSSFGPTLVDATASSVQQLEQQQEKRSSLIMAHYKSGVALPSLPNKQTGRPNFPPVIQHLQTLIPPSLSSLEVRGTRYAPNLQQQLNSANSLLHSPTGKGKCQHLPSVCEANVAGVRSDNVTLQLVCDHYI